MSRRYAPTAPLATAEPIVGQILVPMFPSEYGGGNLLPAVPWVGRRPAVYGYRTVHIHPVIRPWPISVRLDVSASDLPTPPRPGRPPFKT